MEQNTIPLPSIRSSPSVAVVEPGDCFLTAPNCFSEVLVFLSDAVGSSVYFRKEQYGFTIPLPSIKSSGSTNSMTLAAGFLSSS